MMCVVSFLSCVFAVDFADAFAVVPPAGESATIFAVTARAAAAVVTAVDATP